MSTSQVVMMVLVVVVLSILMLSTRRRVAKSQRGARTSVRERYDELQRGRNAARDVEDVMLELDQLARQIHGRIDTRLAKLEALIRDADDRIDRLSRITRSGDAAPAIDVTLDEVAPDSAADDAGSQSEDRYASIYRLADSGLSPHDIAAETQRTIGEVELILALRRTKEKSSRSLTAATSAGSGANT